MRAVGPVTWATLTPLIWTGEQDTFTVPIGFETDLATSPRFMHWLVLPYGPYTRAAVLHDYLLTELAAWQREFQFRGRPEGYLPRPPADSRDIDGIFRRAMRDLGVGFAKRWIMWAGVRWGALFNPRRAYGRHFVADMPQVLGVSLLVLLTVVIPVAAIAVLIALGFVRVITWKYPTARRIRRQRPGGAARTMKESKS